MLWKWRRGPSVWLPSNSIFSATACSREVDRELDGTEIEGKSVGEFFGEVLGEGVEDIVEVLMGDGARERKSGDSGGTILSGRGEGCWALGLGKGEKWVGSE